MRYDSEYNVATSEWPSGSREIGITDVEMDAVLDEFPRHYPAAVESLSRTAFSAGPAPTPGDPS
jgi:hypothetical protein